jgi:cell division initiation protein
MITPSDIENKDFTKVVRGYKEEEVDEFLDLIILDMEKLIKENQQLNKELEKAHSQVSRQVSTESSVYETLEAAKSLMNDIAASAERRAQVILKDAELEAAQITRQARESISRLTDEEQRMRRGVERLREKYRQMLELELERAEMLGTGLFEEFGSDLLTASPAESEEPSELSKSVDKKQDLSGTKVNIR